MIRVDIGRQPVTKKKEDSVVGRHSVKAIMESTLCILVIFSPNILVY